jgi:hypothetical protein
LVIGRPQSKTLEDQMRTIKLLLICLSAICTANSSAQEILVPEQKIEWLDLEQNRTNFSVVGDLCQSLIISNNSPLPYLAFRASSPKGEKFIQPNLSLMKTSEIGAGYFDNDQLQLIQEDFLIDIESIQSLDKHEQVITVFPFRKRNGKIERLLSFEVQGTTSFNETKKNNYTYAAHSVLADGDVYKIAIAKDGVYKIDRSFLESLGISVSGLDPNTINIYGNGGALLPEKNFVFKADDLVKNAIHIQGESDGVFNANDYILFYGKREFLLLLRARILHASRY